MLAGCGSVDSGSGSAPTASANGLRFDVAVSEKDTAAKLHVGQKLEVVLHAYSGLGNWSQPASDDPAILAPIVDTEATAVRGVTLAAFQAMAPGVVTVRASAAPICPPGLACPAYALAYSLKVTVNA